MKRIINFRSFNVFTLEKDFWDIDYHKHNFYEIILVENGKGKHRLNGVTFNYKSGDIFLLTPGDAHEFVIERKTKFIYIKYTQQFLLDLLIHGRDINWQEAIKLTQFSRPHIHGSILKSKIETRHVFQLVQQLLYEFNGRHTFGDIMMRITFASILTLITRSLMQRTGKEKSFPVEGDAIEKILCYISVYILDGNKMKTRSLAKTFLMSPNYISTYVKKHTGLSIQQHIIQYKLKIIEKLLCNSNYNINEIAERLGFTDASHINKFFKKHKKMPPTQFRKMGYKD